MNGIPYELYTQSVGYLEKCLGIKNEFIRDYDCNYDYFMSSVLDMQIAYKVF